MRSRIGSSLSTRASSSSRPKVWDDYERVLAGVDGWQAILAGWDVDLVVVEGEDGAGLGARLQREGWREVYRDNEGRILAPGAG